MTQKPADSFHLPEINPYNDSLPDLNFWLLTPAFSPNPAQTLLPLPLHAPPPASSGFAVYNIETASFLLSYAVPHDKLRAFFSVGSDMLLPPSIEKHSPVSVPRSCLPRNILPLPAAKHNVCCQSAVLSLQVPAAADFLFRSADTASVRWTVHPGSRFAFVFAADGSDPYNLTIHSIPFYLSNLPSRTLPFPLK